MPRPEDLLWNLPSGPERILQYKVAPTPSTSSGSTLLFSTSTISEPTPPPTPAPKVHPDDEMVSEDQAVERDQPDKDEARSDLEEALTQFSRAALAICLDYPTESAEQLEDVLRFRRAKVIDCFDLQRTIDRQSAAAAARKEMASQHAVELEEVGVEIRDMASRMQEVLGQKEDVNEQLIASEKEKEGMKGELEQIKRDLKKERESSSECQMLLRAAGRERRQAEDEKEAALKELSDMKQDEVGKRKRAIQSWEHSEGAKFE